MWYCERERRSLVLTVCCAAYDYMGTPQPQALTWHLLPPCRRPIHLRPDRPLSPARGVRRRHGPFGIGGVGAAALAVLPFGGRRSPGTGFTGDGGPVYVQGGQREAVWWSAAEPVWGDALAIRRGWCFQYEWKKIYVQDCALAFWNSPQVRHCRNFETLHIIAIFRLSE